MKWNKRRKKKAEQNGLALFGAMARKDTKTTTKATKKWLKLPGKIK